MRAAFVLALAISSSVALAEPAPPTAFEARLAREYGRAGGITSIEVGRRAAATSWDVRAHRRETEAAEAAFDLAVASFLPRLTMTARYTHLSGITPPSLLGPGASTVNLVIAGAPGPVTSTSMLTGYPVSFSFPVVTDNYLLQGSLAIPLSDYLLRLSSGLAAARGAQRASELSEKATRLKVAADARGLYYGWVRARLGAVVGELAVEQARGHLADAQHGVDAGVASRADLMRVESQVAQLQLLVERARHAADLLEDQLRMMTHDSSDARGGYSVGEDLAVEKDLGERDLGLDALVSEASTHRLELLALDESTGSLRDQSKVARAAAWPRLDAFGDVVDARPNPRIFPQQEQFDMTWDVGVALSWAPTDIAIARASGRQLDARTSQLEAQRAQLADGVRVEVAMAWQALRDALAERSTTAPGLAAAEESYRVRNELYKNGRATSAELTDAESELLRARLEEINARVDLRAARARLDHAVGRDVEK